MNDKLISMTIFVSNISSILPRDLGQDFDSWTLNKLLSLIENYSKFLRQPLTLGMFVPCDEQGNVLQETPPFQFYGEHTSDTAKRVWGYNEAKERVLFKGFEVRSHIDDEGNEIEYVGTLFKRINKGEWIADNTLTVERLANQEVYLTDAALKQIQSYER